MITIGHRGAAFLEPENTLRGFRKAMELGVDYVELDVHLTKDNELVVIHDETVDRTTNGKGAVADLMLEEIRKLDAGNGEKIPALQEVIDLARNRIGLMIELKGRGTAKPVVDAIEGNGLKDVIVKSFYHDMAKEVKELSNRIETALLLVGAPVSPARVADDAKADGLSLNFNFVEKDTVDKAHKGNKKVFVWNCDTEEDITRMMKLGVDGVCSNRPDVLVKVVKKR